MPRAIVADATPIEGEQKAIVIGCRPSTLAKIQAELVRSRLKVLFPASRFEISSKKFPQPEIGTSQITERGGASLWTTELEDALFDGDIDILVHSLKDVPTKLKEGCEIIHVLEREDRRDCLVVKDGLPYRTLEELPAGSVVGTGSVRRVAQMKRRYPLLVIKDVRGNIDTRLQKLDSPDLPYTALILASAGLLRLSLHDRITSYLSPPISYPAVGQGCLGAEFRSADTKVKAMVSRLEVWQDGWAVRAERALLWVLEGGCAFPVGIWSSWSGDNIASESLSVMTSPDGSEEITVETTGVVASVEEVLELGKQAARSLLEKGGRGIIVDLRAEIDRAASEY
ncbi:uncharacterized protein LACBIDRAFT_248667 [Laccaria bicolor S238N-H82]|uniref:hydroxymethylbilane synthase n=1 Tax=Laccaria bicolor (strain S238N-H82 / ATCC MYA-4686) TaxID=486041 RepID=B0D5Q2_LACBS|nr:uncharacterized protein LACBIDRAFT_248667 [Laccaria bicolor S238N-H82]EDR10060.1 predicted protein [Laccaria bicolor S238N-H82]|eukprot:XP_001879445.1 predicted protein [Laccaria bicolor S238N-H82]